MDEPGPYLDPDTKTCKHPDIPFYDIICNPEVEECLIKIG